MIASLKCQYTELLADIGFIKADLTARKIGRLAPRTGDGVLAATGELVSYTGGVRICDIKIPGIVLGGFHKVFRQNCEERSQLVF